jgi:hypothetical protein
MQSIKPPKSKKPGFYNRAIFLGYSILSYVAGARFELTTFGL